jgi:hypothetical protein
MPQHKLKPPPRPSELKAARSKRQKAQKTREKKAKARAKKARVVEPVTQGPRIQLSLLQGEPDEVIGKASDECYTPAFVLDPISRLLDGIDTDPCWSPRSLVKPRRAGYTIADRGDEQPWFGSAWVQPPYSGPDPFVDRAVAHAAEGHKVALLVNVDPSTLWWERTYLEKHGRPADLAGLWPNRIGFLGEFAGGNPARSSSALFLWNIEDADALRELPRVLWYKRVTLAHADPPG